ncbi:MAG: hypothetical protein ACPHY8_06670 [Patescibacteria group bacterium]
MVELIKKPIIDEYLENLAEKQDPYADYEVIVYNLNDNYYQTVDYIFEQTKHINFKNKDIQYDYNNLLLVQKINLLKFQYHILHKQNFQAQETITQIFKINDVLLKNSYNYIDVKAYITIQNFTLDYYEKYKSLFS